MDNKLENRISRLEKLLNNSKSTKNESTYEINETVYNAANQVRRVCQSLAVALQAAKDINIIELENTLSLLEDDFPVVWFERYNKILSRK